MQKLRVDVWDPVADALEQMAAEAGVSPHRIVSDALTMFCGLDLEQVTEPAIDHRAPFRLGRRNDDDDDD